ncbi:7644_t:CDS:2 [Ambispora gerdemannii]|uniref:7644_t:CDS:1 n=1 Tax=Ambispora gerdemannii TaxID=144530 RepID=A0A9N9A3P1_9GLOM|nr:7644_t:CDS:2 [Ambispora gerdemannii]
MPSTSKITKPGVSNVPEKYQERAKARRRGAGRTHQTAIRNFTIQIPKKKDTQQPSPPSIPSISPTTHSPLPLSNILSEVNEQAEETLLASNTPPPEPIISNTTENIKNTNITIITTNTETRRVISRGSSRRVKIKCYKFKPSSIRDKHGKIIKRAARVGVNTIDVIGETIYSTIIGYNDQTIFKKELQLFKEQVEVFLIEQTDLSDEHGLLQSSLRNAKSRSNQLRKELFNTQKERENNLEQVHDYLSELQALRESVYADEDTMEEDNEIKDSYESLLANITTRCGDLSISSFTPIANRSIGLEDDQKGHGTLGILQRFNNLLEAMDATIRETTTNTENGVG